MGSNNFLQPLNPCLLSATENKHTGIETQFFFFPFL